MDSNTTTQTHPIRNTIIAAALAVAVAVPVTSFAVGGQQALAANESGTTTTALVAAETDDATCEDCEYLSNEEYVASLVGLTNAEKQELLALYDKWDAMADDEDFTDAEWNRISELENKAWYAEMEEYINSDSTITDDQRATYLRQLDQMKDLDAYFEAYFSDPTYLEKCDQYDSISESLGNYMGWDYCYDCDTEAI